MGAPFLLTLALVLAARPPVVAAQSSDDDRARGHFQAGTSYFDQGRFSQAAEQFDEAYRLSARVTLLLNASVAYERAGDLRRAIERLEAYLASDAAEVESSRTTLTTRLAMLRAREAEALAARRADPPPMDTTATDPTPREADALAAHDDPDARDASASADAASGGSRLGAYLTGGLALSLSLVGLGTGLRARGLDGTLQDACGPGGDHCPVELADELELGPRLVRVTRGALGAAGGFAVASTLWFVLAGDETASTVAVVPMRSGLALTVGGRFR